MASNDGNQSLIVYDVVTGFVWGIGYIVVAGIFFYSVIHQFSGYTNSVFDVIYFPVVLMTSSGYNDLTPKSTLAKLIAILFALAGVAVFGVLVGHSAKILVPMQQDLLKIFDMLLEDPKVQYCSKIKKRWKGPLLLFAVHMVFGAVLLASFGNMDIGLAIRCVSSTLITVLNQDKCFSTKLRRIFAVFWILLGMFTVGWMVYEITEVLTQRSNWLFAKKNLFEYGQLVANLEGTQKFDADGNMKPKLFIISELKELMKSRKQDNKIKDDSNKKQGQIDAVEKLLSWIEAELLQYVNKHDFWEVFKLLVAYVTFSMVTFYVARDHIKKEGKTNNGLDTLYFTFITMTSAGYGDIRAKNEALALTLASIFAILGLIIFGQFLTIGSTFLASRRKQIQGRVRLRDPVNTPTTMALLPKLIKQQRKIVGISFMVLMVAGTVFVIPSEKLKFIHALYCISTTITNAGIDKCFSTERGRIFAIIWMFFGAIFKYYVIFIITNIHISIREEKKEPPREEELELEKQKPEKPKREPKPKHDDQSEPSPAYGGHGTSVRFTLDGFSIGDHDAINDDDYVIFTLDGFPIGDHDAISDDVTSRLPQQQYCPLCPTGSRLSFWRPGEDFPGGHPSCFCPHIPISDDYDITDDIISDDYDMTDDIISDDNSTKDVEDKEIDKLLETKLVSKEDVAAIMKKFKRLGIDPDKERLTLRQVMLLKRKR